MKVSYNWLQTYFKEKLPEPEKLAELLTFHVFEIESLEHIGNDWVLDVKVLPDRARYALSHKGIAYGISAIANIPQNDVTSLVSGSGSPPYEGGVRGGVEAIVHVEDSAACPRYVARYVAGVTVGDSPAWLKEKLEVLGQRSINNIVDAANYVMLDIGQPLHTFDADKIKGAISVRKARAGEKITTLDGKDIALDETILVIADEIGPLVIAGIKGGERAGVTVATKNIIIESANFNASLIRKTTMAVGIRTDASKRYENALNPEYAEEGMLHMSALIAELAKPSSIGPVSDTYPHPIKSVSLSVSSGYLTERLGVVILDNEISAILKRLLLSHEVSKGTFIITIPSWRGDLSIPQDIVEEVGRIYGYDKIPAQQLPATSFRPKATKHFYYENSIKDILTSLGFSEVITYIFGANGELQLEKSLASDKSFLRSSLADGIKNSLELNARNADILGLDKIKIFEIGNVFTKKGEELHLAVGVKNIKKTKIKESDELQEVVNSLTTSLGKIMPEIKGRIQDSVFEINLDEFLAVLPEPATDYMSEKSSEPVKYQKISAYPFAVRDIAVFTPADTEEKAVRDIIEQEAGILLVRNTLFDVFTKKLPDGTSKISYAFRLVLQSQEKTLTEDEINSIMTRITSSMNACEGWQVR